MKAATTILSVVLMMLFPAFTMGQILDKDQANLTKPEVEIYEDVYWQIKAYRPNAKSLEVKAITADGKFHDIKGIQSSDDTSVLNVKAIIDDNRLPVKLVVSEGDRYYPVKAIGNDGSIIKVKAITDKGEILPLKGVSKSGNIIHLRAIADEGIFYNIIAESPKGEVNIVKGVKMLDTKVETVINGVSVFAHVKALHQNKENIQ